MSLEDVWKEDTCPLPDMPGMRLVFTTRKHWKHQLGHLEVKYCLTSSGESTHINLNGEISEEVIIQRGVIVSVRSHYRSCDFPSPDAGLSEEEFSRRFNAAINPKATPRPQYVEIKTCEKDLRLLPEQEDLQAIYNGNGFFEKSS
ncbi:MAG: hypothetical protein AABY01_02580 [Nanoarchaeota archaeon]